MATAHLTDKQINDFVTQVGEVMALSEAFRPSPGESEVFLVPRAVAERLCYVLGTSGQILGDMARRELAEQAKRNDPALSSPGMEGALLRLLSVCDFDQAHGWITSEVVRGTGPSDRFEVVSAVCANLITLAVFSVKDKHMAAASQILGRVGERVHQMVGGILAKAGKPVAPRLRIVTEGDKP